MDQLAAIKVFVAVADAGSLSAAGRRLSMPLTTVSRHLAALEDLVGVRLITRTTRELALTETGRHYLESCRRILAELDAARLRVAGAQDEPQGELAITAPVAFGRLHVLPIVTAFLKSSPRVTARMLLIDRVVDLIEEGIDISLRIGTLPDSSLRATRVGAIRLITCASPPILRSAACLPRRASLPSMIASPSPPCRRPTVDLSGSEGAAADRHQAAADRQYRRGGDRRGQR